jgi:hypothetical protein
MSMTRASDVRASNAAKQRFERVRWSSAGFPCRAGLRGRVKIGRKKTDGAGCLRRTNWISSMTRTRDGRSVRDLRLQERGRLP